MDANEPELKWIEFDATTIEAEELLIAEFFVWEHMLSRAKSIMFQLISRTKLTT